MTNETADFIRAQMAAFLPRALGQALARYTVFTQGYRPDPEDDGRKFKVHCDACKMAASHIELLVDMGRHAGAEKPEKADKNEAIDLGALIEQCRADVAAFEGKDSDSTS